MEKTLLSIGHSQHQVDYFINLLKSHDVNYILDFEALHIRNLQQAIIEKA